MKVNKAITVSFAVLSMLALLVPMVFAPTPIVQQVTGGGWILTQASCQGTEEAKKTFGFNAQELEDGTFRGNVEYVDHGPFGPYEKGFPHVHGYEITDLAIMGNEAYIWGHCRLNGEGNKEYSFIVHVIDVDEPGKHDLFEILVQGHGLYYIAGAELGFPDEAGGGGNIQIHRPAP